MVNAYDNSPIHSLAVDATAAPEKSSVSQYGGDNSDWIISSIVGGAAAAFLISFAALAPHPGVSGWALAMDGVLAALIGWGAGIIATPYNDYEKGRLGQIVTALVSFVSGYVVSTLNLSAKNEAVTLDQINAVLNSPIILGVAMFFASFLNSFILTYIQRSYQWTRSSKKRATTEPMGR
jgi:hypothetical protein